MRFIPDGPPVVTSVTHTDEPGFEARVLCLVDGFPAEIHHEVNTKRQEYSRHNLDVFDPVQMTWHRVISWGFTEAGHIPIHPEPEIIGNLRGLSEVMWRLANTIVTQSRLRQQEIDVAQYAAEHMEHQRRLDAYNDERFAADLEDDEFPAVEHGEIVASFGPANDDVESRAAQMVAHDAAVDPFVSEEADA